MLFLRGAQFAGLWGIFLGWFLSGAATSAAHQNELKRTVTGVTVGRLIAGPAVFVSGEMTGEDLVERYFLRYAGKAFPVVRDRTIVGVVAVGDLSGLSLDERAARPVFDLMLPLDAVPALQADRPLLEAVQLVRSGGHDRILVVRDVEVLGALSREEIAEWVSRSATRRKAAAPAEGPSR